MTDRPDPREVVREALIANIARAVTTKTDAILAALTASGYTIVPAAGGEVGEVRDALTAAHDRFAVFDGVSNDDLCAVLDAASHLERLAAENERLKVALEWYASLPAEWTINAGAGLTYGNLHLLGEKARAALTQEDSTNG